MTSSNTLLARSLSEAPRSRSRSLFTLLLGLVAGFFLSQFASHIATTTIIYPLVQQHSAKHAHSHAELALDEGPEHEVFHHEHKEDNTTIADKLKKEVRILCWVMTNPKNHKSKARHVKRTWGKRCNILLFMSSAEDSELPTVKLDVGEGRENLWRKVKEAFKYVYKHHYNDADWFYKADDDTYAIIENMRYMLYPYSPETPVHFGYKFRTFVKQGYMSGGAGYVLSREALRRFVVEGIPNPKMCLPGTVVNEDIEIGRCMEHLNVTAGDSRDSMGRGRMFPFIPESHLIPPKYNKKYWYWSYQYYKNDDGLDCCSDLAISWHYVAPNLMYVMDYLIYHLKPYGLLRKPEPLPAKLKVGELLPAPIDQPAASNEDSVDDEDRLIKATTVKGNHEPDARELSSKEVDSDSDQNQDEEETDSQENDASENKVSKEENLNKESN
ncbi:uncharacterized protein Dwil_GK24753 [Drosophila willistoni]|uniref:Glycoprotein-N-acetylgalactosamine 3-beta-galactosyltransferase 1 n=1 Tax=Drosophila willistoni TaxID=7260 RepID=B4N006_DROWI|nr:glycoprotein-N-acetylgalactosamine 3-beta-galactosyltransferase 1 [Drosophila willistoni]EDW77941.1 uncharacterized protein Dwil_GK24753 [Drosophila willistoni]